MHILLNRICQVWNEHKMFVKLALVNTQVTLGECCLPLWREQQEIAGLTNTDAMRTVIRDSLWLITELTPGKADRLKATGNSPTWTDSVHIR